MHTRPAVTTPAADSALDWVFFVVGGLAAVWLVWTLLRESFSFGWWQLLFAVMFWIMLAYLVLPRLHRILTRIYVPDYFIGRARTSDGLLGDPVNLALLASEEQVHAAMTAAGWIRADDLSLRTGLRIVRSTLLRRSYLEAPVSPLLLFGRSQDFAYQQEVDGSPGKRHHVRFWHCPEGWKLPGGMAVDWLAAGTYDRSVGLSLFTLQVTHKIAADTDAERDHIIATIVASTPSAGVRVIRDFSSGYHARNGGGDSIVTDGDLPILTLDTAGTRTEVVPSTDSRDRRPSPTITGAAFILLRAIASVATAVLLLVSWDAKRRELSAEGLDEVSTSISMWVVVVVSLLYAIVELVLARSVFFGHNWSRVLAMSLSTAAIGAQIIAVESGVQTASLYSDLIGLPLDVLLLIALSSERARIYATREHRSPKRLADQPGGLARF